ncbi:MAG: hypothetical protein AAGM45_12530 [Cyanobacteria bacterium J06588_5]
MTLVFSLIGGLLVAIAIQLVFANLGIALGLTVLDWSPGEMLGKGVESDRNGSSDASDPNTLDNESDDQEPAAKQSLPITHFLGFGVAVGFSSVIFIATLLSVEFAQLIEPRRGIVFGLIFWSTYWLLFIWLSSTTIAGIADSLLGTALEGGKKLVSTLRQSVQTPEASSNQPTPEKSMLQELVAEVSSLNSELNDVQQALPTLLASQREDLLKEICDRTNLSTEEAETIVEELEPTPSPAIPAPTPTTGLMSQLDPPSWQQILRQALNKVDLSEWDVETIWEQLPIENSLGHNNLRHQAAQLVGSATSVLPQARTSAEESTSQTEQVTDSHPKQNPSPTLKAIQAKIISYCRYTNTDSLSPEKLIEKVEAQREDYGLLKDKDIENMSLDIKAIEDVLSRRKNLTSTDRTELMEAFQLAWPVASSAKTIDTVVVESPDTDGPQDTAEDADLSARAIATKAYQTLEAQFQSIDWSKASLEDIKPEVNLILEQLEHKETLRSLDWSALTSRVQLTPTARTELTTWLQTAWSEKVQALRPAATRSAQQLSQQLADQITHILHHQEKSELEPAKIAKKLTQAVTGTLSSLPNPSEILDYTHLSTLLDKDTWDKKLWNKDTWQQALEKRKDLTAEEIQQILEWGEHVWHPKAQQVGSWLQAAQTEVSEYLPNLSLPEIGLPEGNPLAEMRQQIVGKIAAAQEKVSERATALRQDLQTQADAARRQVAIAAWWLFIALVLSGSAAAKAGYLAAIY